MANDADVIDAEIVQRPAPEPARERVVVVVPVTRRTSKRIRTRTRNPPRAPSLLQAAFTVGVLRLLDSLLDGGKH